MNAKWEQMSKFLYCNLINPSRFSNPHNILRFSQEMTSNFEEYCTMYKYCNIELPLF